MPLRIAFDVDGVLADMDAAVDRVAQTLFDDPRSDRTVETLGAGPSEADPSPESHAHQNDLAARLEKKRLSPSEQRLVSERVRAIENFWETLGEIEPGAVARLAMLAREQRWDVIFLTRRPPTAGETPQVQTQRWLQRHGFPIPSVYIVSGSRGQVASALALDVVVDDRPENCLDVVLESTARAILVRRDGGEEIPAKARRVGIGVVASMAACLDILERGGEPGNRPGVLTRIKRLLGIEPV